MSALPISELFGGGGPQSVIKSVQRGKIAMPQHSGLIDVTISAVNLSKSFAINLGVSFYGTLEHDGFVSLSLINETTLRVERGGNQTSNLGTAYISYQVVEFY